MTPLRRVRLLIVLFIVGLALSGVTAFPLVGETALLERVVAHVAPSSAMFAWVHRVHEALAVTGEGGCVAPSPLKQEKPI